MRISELIKALDRHKQAHGNLEVVYTRYSDYGVMTEEEITVQDAVPVKGSAGKWMMRSYPENFPVETAKVLHFRGN